MVLYPTWLKRCFLALNQSSKDPFIREWCLQVVQKTYQILCARKSPSGQNRQGRGILESKSCSLVSWEEESGVLW